MSEKEVAGYWNTKRVCEYFGGISSRTLNRWKNREQDPFPKPAHSNLGAKSLYKVQDVVAWDLRQHKG